MAGIVLVYVPGVDDVTLTLIVQVPLAAIVALFNVRDVFPLAIAPPPGPVREAEAPQVVRMGDGGFAITMLVGKLSVSEVCVSEVEVSLFLTVIVSTLDCPTQMVLGAKLLLNEGGWTLFTCNVALAGVVFVTAMVPVGSVDFNVLVGILLMWFPAIVEVTFTVTVQDPGVVPTCAGTLPPMRDNTVPETETIPPQLLVAPLGLAKFRFAVDRSSVQAGGVVDRFRANEFGL